MCRFCEEPCWRDGGERECAYDDATWERIADEEDRSAGTPKRPERPRTTPRATSTKDVVVEQWA